MFKNSSAIQHESSVPQNNAAQASAGVVCAHQPAEASAVPFVPGRVIPGESFQEEPFPESGESYSVVVRGKRPCLITHPLPHPDVPGYAAITDYLNVTFKFQTSPEALRLFMVDLLEIIGARFAPAKELGKGFNGYQRSFELGAFGCKFGCVGQAGTALLSMPGQACALIPDWDALIVFLRDRYNARITRWDGAVDDFEGNHPVDWAVEQYKAGGFTNGGNKPSSRQNGNWIEQDGMGRTLYIGKRQNGKMLRVYEKGMQCGHVWHPWVRYEVELHNVDRVIPWDVLLDPGKYVAGAYPKALAWVNDEMCRVRTLRKEGTLAYGHLVKCASNAYGSLINVMMEVEGSPENVVKKLRKTGMPARLNLPVDQPCKE